jgi:hypothetical protein
MQHKIKILENDTYRKNCLMKIPTKFEVHSHSTVNDFTGKLWLLLFSARV